MTTLKSIGSENINDPYDDAWGNSFFPTAEKLVQEADAAAATDKALAIQLYKRASTVYRISRFPYIATKLQRQAYEAQKSAYMKGATLWDVPLKDISVPFTGAAAGDVKEIPLYTRIPPNASKENPVPVMFLITGLDGHRPDNSEVFASSMPSNR
jgi:hypothetical protein